MNRSELEQRAKARKAALKSDTEVDLEARAKARRAYFQGANEPQAVGYPQEMKYPHMDPPIGDVRDWEQQWFEGAAAASKPNMGPAGAELELKKKLQRASLSAKFTKKANRKESFWEFFATDKDSKKKGLLFRASVNDIYGHEDQNIDDEHWNWVSSQDYAKEAMSKMRSDGLEKVAYALTGVGITREGTIALIQKAALAKAKKITLLGRRVARNVHLASGQVKQALAQDYADLQAVLADLKLVAKTVSDQGLVKASPQNRIAAYRIADEALVDASSALNDVSSNVATAEKHLAALSKKAEEMVEEAPDGDAAPAPGGAPAAPMGGGDNTNRATQMDPPMPGGGMTYEQGGELYPAPDERMSAKPNPTPHASHPEPYLNQQFEQLQLMDLAEVPSGNQHSFDKAESGNEVMVVDDSGKVPTGDLATLNEAAGGGISHVEEGAPSDGLSPDGAGAGGSGNYMHLPYGGAGAGEAPMADPNAPEGSPEEEASETPEEEEAEHEEGGEEEAEGEESEEEEEEEEKPTEASVKSERQLRAEKRANALKSVAWIEGDTNGPAYSEKLKSMTNPADQAALDYRETQAGGVGPAFPGSTKEQAFNAMCGGGGAAPAAAAGAPAAPEAEEDAEVKAAFNAKKVEAQKKDASLKQKRAYDLALDFADKNWIPKTKEAVHHQASLFASLDEKAFQVFKEMVNGVRPVQREASEKMEEKVERIAGRQRRVIKSGTSEETDLIQKLKDLPWS